MTFQIDEKSWIKVKKGNLPEEDHREITDAMQTAVNWLATQPVNTVATITETTRVTRTS